MKIKQTGLVLIGVIIGYFIFGGKKDYNQTLKYGNTGYPKNCRAIIAENIKEYKNKNYSAEDILESIERNCGENGYSWAE